MNAIKSIILPLTVFALLTGCQDNSSNIIEEGQYSDFEYETISSRLNLPKDLLEYNLHNSDNIEESNHKATLGRVLFYDKSLSADGKISCESCHQQSLAFSDNKKFSHGINGNLTSRNSIALGSLQNFGAHYDNTDEEKITPRLFWDERAGTVKEQLKQTINDPNEMGMTLQEVTKVIEQENYYQVLFEKAFDSKEINEDRILESLEAFINSIGSRGSKFETALAQDLNYISGDSIVGIIANQQGFNLFSNHCSSCHGDIVNLPNQEAIFQSINVANNGLKTNNNDLGVYQYSLNTNDIGKFKVPGLRNIELTGPYMHDGRFETLEEVVEFYNSGIEMNSNLHESLKVNGRAKRLNLSDDEKASLVLFLESLTDTRIIDEEKWSNPFYE